MKTTKRFLLTLAAIFALTAGAWAQDAGDEVSVSPTANANEWTLTMPASDIELQVEYESALALDETDNNGDALAEWNGYEADVTLTRTLQAGG